MKILYKLIILLCLLTGCNPEQNQGKIVLPSFVLSVEMHENVLVFDNNDGYDDTTGNELNEIVLFDVDKSKILYKYSFDKEFFKMYIHNFCEINGGRRKYGKKRLLLACL